MTKAIERAVVVAFVAFVIWQLAMHPHAPAIFIHAFTGHN